MNKQTRIEAARLAIQNLKLDALINHGWTRGAAQMGLLQASAHPYREALR